jgi:hypothetical protein
LPADATCENADSVTIVTPSTGTIIVSAIANVEIANHTTGSPDGIEASIATTNSNCIPASTADRSFWSIPAAMPTLTLAFDTMPVRGIFAGVSAGSNTYYLNGFMEASSGGPGQITGDTMVATFYPS